MLLPTSLVGSYAQPDWLIDREKLAGRFPPRTRMKDLWRVPEQYLVQAWDDATIYAIADQERAGRSGREEHVFHLYSSCVSFLKPISNPECPDQVRLSSLIERLAVKRMAGQRKLCLDH